ncbi:ribonucleoside triphosphate reductase [Fusibacter paucivorans]|uniref:Ribonucleoside triphosphate reductase n=1 Tax=Fusibacter paucivorans TaxID=76009 RepID=A0ABS5PS00_9FIRM|nr:ribonucleoside triphosphate reductase [Fusibacter paucivorans]MBS7527647.1 ribonucleoside triphosphate reductase [Fusibacter paucivorans]
MILQVIKREGQNEVYNANKIEGAMAKAFRETGVTPTHTLSFLVAETVKRLDKPIVHIEAIQDAVEQTLMAYGYYAVAKAYILYREEHAKSRLGIDHYINKIDEYMDKIDWRVTENSNAHYSYGALNKYISEMQSRDYWLHRVYPSHIANAYKSGDFHIHDLGALTVYCCGYSLMDIIRKGVKGISNIPSSKPAKHFGSLLAQVANLTTIYQNEIAGAVAFSSFDTLTAPFVKEDNLSYTEVKQEMQSFIFQINSNSRGGAEPAFSNLTFDLMVPSDMANTPAIIAGKPLDYNYDACQAEMDMINKAFYEVMLEGDANGAVHSYPIPTYNIHKAFDWDRENEKLLWEMTGKYGIPYFANFINSDMKPEDARSMCCRLRLDKRELVKRNGGLFGSGEKTGSIGVVTLNLPRYAYEAKTKEAFFEILDRNMLLAKESLVIKRKFLKQQLDRGLLPAFMEYVGTLDNHFSTIGYVGANEMCENLLGEGIDTEAGYAFTYEVLEYMRDRMRDFQEETGDLFNLEATPAESTAYKLATTDRKIYKDIKTQGESVPYYTNSCHMPVKKVKDIHSLYDHQHKLQALHTGGTVIHNYLETSISGDKAKAIIKYVTENFEAPYTSLSPVYSICETHGFIHGNQETCPHCGAPVESYQRVTGYIRPVSRFNDGKKAEFKDRKQIDAVSGRLDTRTDRVKDAEPSRTHTIKTNDTARVKVRP